MALLSSELSFSAYKPAIFRLQAGVGILEPNFGSDELKTLAKTVVGCALGPKIIRV